MCPHGVSFTYTRCTTIQSKYIFARRVFLDIRSAKCVYCIELRMALRRVNLYIYYMIVIFVRVVSRIRAQLRIHIHILYRHRVSTSMGGVCDRLHNPRACGHTNTHLSAMCFLNRFVYVTCGRRHHILSLCGTHTHTQVITEGVYAQ